jgi:hypothetical protein
MRIAIKPVTSYVKLIIARAADGQLTVDKLL